MPDEKKELADRIQRELNTKSKQPEAARNAIGLLFPALSNELKTYTEPLNIHEQRQKFKISNREFAYSYFGLQPGLVLWSKRELGDVFDTTSPQEALEHVEKRIAEAPADDQSRLRRTFLEQLSSAFSTRRAIFSGCWLDALVYFSGVYIRAYDDQSELMFSIRTMSRLEAAVEKGLAQLDESKRAEVFQLSVAKADDISLLCDTFRGIAGDVHSDGAKRQRIDEADFGDATDSIRKALLQKVSVLVETGKFWSQADPWLILWFWWGCDLENEVKTFTRKELDHRTGLFSLLDITVHQVLSTGGNYEVVAKSVDKIIDTGLLAELAADVIEGDKNEQNVLKARRFLNALDNRKKERT